MGGLPLVIEFGGDRPQDGGDGSQRRRLPTRRASQEGRVHRRRCKVSRFDHQACRSPDDPRGDGQAGDGGEVDGAGD